MSTHLLQGFGFWSYLFTLDVLLLFSPLCLFRMSAGLVMGMNNVSRLIQNMLKIAEIQKGNLKTAYVSLMAS